MFSVKKFKLFKYNKKKRKKFIKTNSKIFIKSELDKKILRIIPKNLKTYSKDLGNSCKLLVILKNGKICHLSYIFLDTKISADIFFKTKKNYKAKEAIIGPTYTFKKFRNQGLYTLALNRIIKKFHKNYNLFISTEINAKDRYIAFKSNNFVYFSNGYLITFFKVFKLYINMDNKKLKLNFSCYFRNTCLYTNN